MDQELKARWVAALRCGEYAQAYGKLRSEDGSAFCCLGVLLDIHGAGFWEEDAYIVGDGEDAHTIAGELGHYAEHLGLPSQVESTLISLNDGQEDPYVRQHSFAEIADFIEGAL